MTDNVIFILALMVPILFAIIGVAIWGFRKTRQETRQRKADDLDRKKEIEREDPKIVAKRMEVYDEFYWFNKNV